MVVDAFTYVLAAYVFEQKMVCFFEIIFIMCYLETYLRIGMEDAYSICDF